MVNPLLGIYWIIVSVFSLFSTDLLGNQQEPEEGGDEDDEH